MRFASAGRFRRFFAVGFMNAFSMPGIRCLASTWRAMALILTGVGGLGFAAEETFPTLQIGTRSYTNVTVTTKAKGYVFFLHATGMMNVKVADLTPDVKAQLGYTNQPQVTHAAAATAWAQQKLARIGIPQFQRLEQIWSARSPGGLRSLPPLSSNMVLGLLAAVLFLYLFSSYCGLLICRKTGHEPGILIWVPVLQLLPLLRSAGMPQWWFVAFLVPFLNLVAHVLWSVKIVQARAKSLWVALWLLLPVANFFALLYLAFSSAEPREKRRVVEIMTLETA
jgi:hypothetical protein